jgi:hypothetical protein
MNKISYSFNWSQNNYSIKELTVGLQNMIDQITEENLESSKFEEALEVINMIRNKQ